jgi:H+/Cl- antiporter ClcA
VTSHPDFSQIRHVVSPDVWRDRLVVWLSAVVAGLCVVGFAWMTDAAGHGFRRIYDAAPWLPLLLTPFGGMAVVWLTRHYAAGATGSGIPQVIAALDANVPTEKHGLFVSLKLSLCKALLGTAAIASGFSAGREGPSVQIAAGVMLAFHRFIRRSVAITPRDMILAGGAAGIAAAFNTPLAGIVFAIEELGKRFEEQSSGLLITAIVIAGLVAISLTGNLTYFGRIQITNIPFALFGPAVLAGIVSGIAGGLFSRLLVSSLSRKHWRINRFRGRYPICFAGLCGLVVAVLGISSDGAAFGSGSEWARGLLNGNGDVPMGYAAVKFLATWASFWSCIPGGIFAPALSIGAGIGHDIAMLTGAMPVPLIALGMAGFLAAVTQAPITAFIIVMEMTDGHTAVLSLMAASLFGSVISRLISAPLYHSLAQLQLQRAES